MWNKSAVEKKVEKFILSENLLSKEWLCIVALSGGADSVALLRILLSLGYKVEAAHCNFKLRGEESERDEEFCRNLCKELGVSFHTVHFDTREYADLRGVSIEMAARELRYNWFEKLRQDLNAQCVCVAHHRDDSVETVLLNLVRGTGIHGLTGISSSREGIVRPLLCLWRREIEEYMREKGCDYVTDSSNLVADVQRNKVRLNILPALKEINPAAAENIANAADLLSKAGKVYDKAIDRMARNVFHTDGEYSYINKDGLKLTDSPSDVLYHLLSGYGFNRQQTMQILTAMDGQPGKLFCSGDTEVGVDRDSLVICENGDTGFEPHRIPEEGTYVFGKVKIRIKVVERTDDFRIPKNADTAVLDADKAIFPLTIRRTETGDRFHPFGMKGSKLMSDYLTDLKFNLFEKRRQLVLLSNEEIAWVVNRRPDKRFAITDETRRVLVVETIH